MRLQEGIGLGKMLTSKEAPISRKRTRMWSLQDQMIGIWRQKFLFHLRRSAPEQENDRLLLLIYNADHRIRKLLPANILMGICLMRPHGKYSI